MSSNDFSCAPRRTLTSCHYLGDLCCAAACCELVRAITSLGTSAAQPRAANLDKLSLPRGLVLRSMLQRRMTCHSLGDFSSSAAQLCCRLQSAVTSSGSLKKSPDSNYLNYNQFHQCLYFANVPDAPSAKSPNQTEKYKMDDSLRFVLSSYIKGPINQTSSHITLIQTFRRTPLNRKPKLIYQLTLPRNQQMTRNYPTI